MEVLVWALRRHGGARASDAGAAVHGLRMGMPHRQGGQRAKRYGGDALPEPEQRLDLDRVYQGNRDRSRRSGKQCHHYGRENV